MSNNFLLLLIHCSLPNYKDNKYFARGEKGKVVDRYLDPTYITMDDRQAVIDNVQKLIKSSEFSTCSINDSLEHI